ncbi:unnamed protein product, partial [Iphiclides podalirius]
MGVVFKEIYDQFPHEKVVGVFRMTTPCLFLRDLDVIKQVLIKDFDYFSDRGVSVGDKGLSNNIFHADTDKWRVLRNRFTPIFSSGKLKNMMYLLDECGDKFTLYLKEQCLTKREHDVHPLLQRYTMAAISACAFGLDIDTFKEKIDIWEKIDKLITTPTFVDELDMMFPGVLKKMNMEVFPTYLSGFFRQVVATVIAQRNGVPSNRRDFMDLILELRQQGKIHSTRRYDDSEQIAVELTEDVIAALAFVFYAAGYETSARTMTHMLYELAQNLEIQNKLVAEVDEVLKKHEGKITYETLNDMHYMKKVLDETLRKYPVVDPLQRRAQADYKIPGTDVTVKKDQIVLISILSIQRDAKYYPNPEKFDPERFSAENASSRHACAYLPFGCGPRNCIGMRFGQVQSFICLARLLSKFRVEPCNKTPPTIQFVAKRAILGAEGIYLNIIPRNN